MLADVHRSHRIRRVPWCRRRHRLSGLEQDERTLPISCLSCAPTAGILAEPSGILGISASNAAVLGAMITVSAYFGIAPDDRAESIECHRPVALCRPSSKPSKSGPGGYWNLTGYPLKNSSIRMPLSRPLAWKVTGLLNCPIQM